ncbi:MAG: Galactose-1-phosphate uridylyltransferase [Clostridia bacterium 41_269]|nr:MAG: Galactose-1-phosphate uridylyltransferase [Clostridia bacterium 41_269]
MPELRRNPLNDIWVIIATERSKRPSDFADTGGEHIKDTKSCPFCLGNEHLTPPEITAVRKNGSKPNTEDWTVRVVPNKFAALQQKKRQPRYK